MLALIVTYLKKEDMHHDQMNAWFRCFSELCTLCNSCFYLCARSFFQFAIYLTSVMINISCFCKRPLSFSAFVKCSCCSVVGHLLHVEPLIEASLKDIGNILTFWIVLLQSIPNPVYLFQGIVLRRGAKGTGMKSIELALSMCDIVDIYGFTVDPGYTEWLALIFCLYYFTFHQLITCWCPCYLHLYLN